MIRGDHRDQLTYLEKKFVTFILKIIYPPTQLFERETLPEALQDKINMIQKIYSKMELKFENQGDLTMELDQSTNFTPQQVSRWLDYQH